MHSETSDQSFVTDAGLLSPVTVGHDELTSDAAFAAHLIAVEVALARAWAAVGVAPAELAEELTDAIMPVGGDADDAESSDGDAAEAPGYALAELDLDTLVEDAVAGGNPVIPLVARLREALPERLRPWVHRGATSQDIMDTALMLMGFEAGAEVLSYLGEIDEVLADFAEDHRDEVAAARTLTQHAVPTTVGLRAANWTRGIARAAVRLDETLAELPVQLGGAAGTLAAFAAIGGEQAAFELPEALAEELGLAVPEAPWHTQRWPVTELGDAMVQAIDAFGVIATDVATLSRTEVGELAEGVGGGSSAMPQKRNPAGSVLIRSAAIRAPHLAATLHTAAALSGDERPDGAWHAEWPVLRELLRLALGAAANTLKLVTGLRVDHAAVRRNLELTSGLIVAERLSIELGPVLGAARVRELIAAAGAGEDLATLLRAETALADAGPELEARIAELLDPGHYTGLAGWLVDVLTIETSPFDTEETP